MEFVLIYDWVDEETGKEYQQWVDWFDTKEELLAAYKEARRRWAYMVDTGRLYLSGAIHYSWADIETNF